MKIHDAKDLNEILNFFKEHNILSIADEVMTGFGKTGNNFASDDSCYKTRYYLFK